MQTHWHIARADHVACDLALELAVLECERNVAAQVVGRRIHLWIDDYYEEVGGNAVGYFLYEPDIEPHP